MHQIKLTLVFLFFCFSISSFGQSSAEDLSVKINDIELVKINGKPVLRAYLNMRDGDSPIVFDDLTITGAGEDDVYRVKDWSGEREETDDVEEIEGGEQVQLQANTMFLLDQSASMCIIGSCNCPKLIDAADAIKSAVKDNNLSSSTTQFASFGTYVGRSQPLELSTFDDQINAIRLEACRDKNTSLYDAVDQKIDELEQKGGRKILIVLTDGSNTVPEGSGGVSKQSVLNKAAQLDSTFRIYTIGLGDPNMDVNSGRGLEEDFLKDLVNSTKNPSDTYSRATSPKNLNAIYSDIVSDFSNNVRVDITPKEKKFCGDTRQLNLEFTYGNSEVKREITEDYRFGSSANCEGEETNFWALLFIGIGLVGLLLFILTFIYPFIGFRTFMNQHVMKYGAYLQKERLAENVRRMDPYTQIPLEKDQQIVTKCEHMMTLESWQANEDRCVFYPDKCEHGVSNYKRGSKFFLQQGVNRQLNWLWYGAVGGFLSWLGFAILANVMGQDWFEDMLTGIDQNFANISDSLFNQFLIAIPVSLFLTLALALVEELGHGGKFSFGKVISRVLFGVLLAVPMFMTAELLYLTALGDYAYLGRLIAWLIFGTAIGFVVSINSSISIGRGMLAGLVGSAVGYHVFYLCNILIANPDYATMIGLICYGAILGLLTVTIVSRLEDFEIEYLSPATFAGRKVAISKWLTRGDASQIFIGTDDNNHVWVKWQDETVQPRHAAISYDGKVYLEPIGETLVNGKIIKGQVELNNGDRIRLGTRSISEMRFHSKEGKATQNGMPSVNDGRQRQGHLRISEEQRRKEEEMKSKIKIKPRRRT